MHNSADHRLSKLPFQLPPCAHPRPPPHRLPEMLHPLHVAFAWGCCFHIFSLLYGPCPVLLCTRSFPLACRHDVIAPVLKNKCSLDPESLSGFCPMSLTPKHLSTPARTFSPEPTGTRLFPPAYMTHSCQIHQDPPVARNQCWFSVFIPSNVMTTCDDVEPSPSPLPWVPYPAVSSFPPRKGAPLCSLSSSPALLLFIPSTCRGVWGSSSTRFSSLPTPTHWVVSAGQAFPVLSLCPLLTVLS